MAPKLTIGLPTYDDLVGVQWTCQALRFHHLPNLGQDVELIVVDNHPTTETVGGQVVESKSTRDLRGYVEGIGGRYIPMAEPVGTAAPRDRIFVEARGEVVVVADSHIASWPGALKQILGYFDQRPESKDIVTGPLLRKRLQDDGSGRYRIHATHYADVWRGGMWGIWQQAWTCPCGRWSFDVDARLVEQPEQPGAVQLVDGAIVTAPPRLPEPPRCTYHALLPLGRPERTACPECGRELPDLPYIRHEDALLAAGYLRRGWSADDTEPFEVTGMGLGMFAMRKEAWPGFCEGMRGFGGGELHLHELVRRRGGKAICLPQAAWWHSFERCGREVPYPLKLWHTVRNYVLWRRRLEMDLEPVRAHFVEHSDNGQNGTKARGSINAAQWEHLLADPMAHTEYPHHLAPQPAPAVVQIQTPPPPKGQRVQPPADAATVAAVYDWLLTTKRDCITHLPTIRRLAEQCQTVAAIVKRREWDVAALAGLPEGGRYVSHNAEQDPLQDLLRQLAGDAYQLDHSDSPTAEPIDCDLLLIDTVHSADRLRRELAAWGPHVRRWIVLRGTRAFGEHAERRKQDPPTAGLLVAAREFMAANPAWKRVFQDDQQYGLSVLSCDPRERTIDRGVGYELHRIYATLGINPAPDCTCRQLAKKMDALGPAGCREHFDELVKEMRANAAKYGWNDHLKAAGKAITTGLVLKLNPLDPIPSCLRLAIGRAEAEERACNDRRRTDQFLHSHKEQ